MSIVKLKTLYKKSNSGKIVQWTISTKDNVITTVWGEVGGKLQETFDVIKTGKNIGKSNETSATQQAEAEALSQWEKKLKKGYVKSQKDATAGKLDKLIEGGKLPMLAKNESYPGDKDKIIKRVKFPCYGQPKLDGMRCVATINKNGKCTLWSRERRPILSVPHIIEEIEKYRYTSLTLDGELYNHEFKDQFEDLISILRKDAPDPLGEYKLAQLHLYDFIGTEETYTERLNGLKQLEQHRPSNIIKFIETVILNNWEEVDAYLDKCVEAGYEGCMLRNMDSVYEGGKRSKHLIKCKFFIDGEFEIVGVEEGRGKLAGKVGKFICKMPDGKTFGASPKMSHKRKKELFENPKQWMGQKGTVTYKRITNDGVPYLPRLKSIRNYE